MLKETNLDEIKKIAENFLYLDINVDECCSVICQHPYTTSPYFCYDGKCYNLLEKNDLSFFYQIEKKLIQNAKSYNRLYMMISKTYKSAFLRYTKELLNREDLSSALRILWEGCEGVNHDPNISKTEYIKLFKASDPEILMSENERKILKSLPDEITIYRGISEPNKKIKMDQIRAMSWTTNLDTAKWFAQRWTDKGKVYESTIKKDAILAYFSSEYETVVDYKKLGCIKRIEDL